MTVGFIGCSWPNFDSLSCPRSPVTLTVIKLLIMNKRSKIRPNVTRILCERYINRVQSVYVRFPRGLWTKCSFPFVGCLDCSLNLKRVQ